MDTLFNDTYFLVYNTKTRHSFMTEDFEEVANYCNDNFNYLLEGDIHVMKEQSYDCMELSRLLYEEE